MASLFPIKEKKILSKEPGENQKEQFAACNGHKEFSLLNMFFELIVPDEMNFRTHKLQPGREIMGYNQGA